MVVAATTSVVHPSGAAGCGGPAGTLAWLLRRRLIPRQGVACISRCRRQTLLYAAGSPSDSVFFLDSGIVKIVKRGPDEREVLITLIRPGEILGEDAVLLGGGLRSATAEVVQEATLFIIPRELFLEFCDEYPEIWRMLTELLARRSHDLQQRIEFLLLRDAHQRVLLYLAELAEALGVEQEGGYAIFFSHNEIAGLVGVARETTSSILNSLAKRGLVKLNRRRLVVTDPALLRELADSPKTD